MLRRTYCYPEVKDENDPNHAIHFNEHQVAGEHYYADSYSTLLDPLQPGKSKTLSKVVAVLVREPENPHDRNAIAIYVLDARNTSHQVGYLWAEDAAAYVETIKYLEKHTKRSVACVARIYARYKKDAPQPHFGCRVYLPDADGWLKWKHTD